MCLCLLLLAFSLAILGDSYCLAWERAEQPAERVRRGGPKYSSHCSEYFWVMITAHWGVLEQRARKAYIKSASGTLVLVE